MADYPEDGGKFLTEAGKILDGKELITYYKREVFQLKAIKATTSMEPDSPWEEAAAAFTEAEGMGSPAESKPRPPSKLKYSCPKCHANAWGKPALKLICGTCWDSSAPVHLELAE